MSIRHGRWLVFTVVLALGACASGPEAADGSAPSAVASSGPSTTASSETDALPQDVAKVESDDLEPGTYFIDPDVDPSTPLRVVYEVPAEGWSAWPGAIHYADLLPDHVSVTITTVRNVVRHACTSSDRSGSSPDLLDVAEAAEVLLHLIGLGVADH
jgi:hypothetical protein